MASVNLSSSSKPNPSELPRFCAMPDCGNTFTGHGSKRYCSRRCSVLNHIRSDRFKPATSEYQRQKRLDRTRRNLESAPPCSICGKTTARVDYQHNKIPTTTALIPDSIKLCKGHLRSYALFIRRNGYQGFDLGEVFTAYLVRITFGTETEARPYSKMMREAFHS